MPEYKEPDWCQILFPHYHDRQGRVKYISEQYLEEDVPKIEIFDAWPQFQENGGLNPIRFGLVSQYPEIPEGSLGGNIPRDEMRIVEDWREFFPEDEKTD